MAASNTTVAREKPTNERRYDTISTTKEEPKPPPKPQPAVMETVPADPPPSYREAPTVCSFT